MRLIIHDFEKLGPDAILAMRAADYLIANPERRDAILIYDKKKEFYAKRNATSISVRLLPG